MEKDHDHHGNLTKQTKIIQKWHRFKWWDQKIQQAEKGESYKACYAIRSVHIYGYIICMYGYCLRNVSGFKKNLIFVLFCLFKTILLFFYFFGSFFGQQIQKLTTKQQNKTSIQKSSCKCMKRQSLTSDLKLCGWIV